jgi:CTP:molybdopterin cytidylyltransferase MocA
MGWVDAETVTSLIEAHGADRAAVLRPAFRGVAGWPVLVPVAGLEMLRVLDESLGPDALIAALAPALEERAVEMGDPGVSHDLDTPRGALPPFEGPPEPPAGHHHEWGSPAASGPDEPPEPPRTVP